MSEIIGDLVGVLIALNDDRGHDALELIRLTLSEVEHPDEAVLAMGDLALMLHQNPWMSLRQIAMQNALDAQAGESTVTRADLGTEFLDIVEGMSDITTPTDEATEILSRFDARPGSSEAVKAMASTVSYLLNEVRLQMASPNFADKTPEQMVRHAINSTRSALRGEGPLDPLAPLPA